MIFALFALLAAALIELDDPTTWSEPSRRANRDWTAEQILRREA